LLLSSLIVANRSLLSARLVPGEWMLAEMGWFGTSLAANLTRW